MEKLKTEPMTVRCSECEQISKTDNLKDFKESNTYPPTAFYICPHCRQMSKLNYVDMPKRLFSRLVKTISDEKGYDDQVTFSKMKSV